MSRPLWRIWCRIALVLAVLQLALVVDPGPAVAERDVGWRPPLDAPVVDPFRPPVERWAPGNRGLTYGATPGQPVAAVDSGTVVFAGPVAGRLHVTVDHGAGLWSTYADVTDIAVVRGQVVRQGQVVAAATSAFMLTARQGGVYVDPALLLAGATPVPRLLPGPAPSLRRAVPAVGAAPPGGGRSLLDRVAGWALGRAEGLVDDVQHVRDRVEGAIGAFDELANRGWQLAGEVATSFTRPFDISSAYLRLVYELRPSYRALQVRRAIGSWWRRGDDCTPDEVEVAPPGGDRVLIQVAGLGTNDQGGSIARLDPVAAGYDPRQVIGFSYAGGCTPVPYGFDQVPAGSLVEELPTSAYHAAHTHQDLEVSAHRLAELIEQVAERRPGASIDLAAHSLGGVVARRALEILDDRHDGPLPVSVVLTLGSPHQGTELAGASVALPVSLVAPVALALLSPQRFVEARAPSTAQLARGTTTHLAPPRPPPDGVRVVSVAAPGDAVVPAANSWWRGATNTIAGDLHDVGLGAHGELPGQPEVLRELALALAGLPARCLSFARSVGAALVGSSIGAAEAAVVVVGLAWLP